MSLQSCDSGRVHYGYSGRLGCSTWPGWLHHDSPPPWLWLFAQRWVIYSIGTNNNTSWGFLELTLGKKLLFVSPEMRIRNINKIFGVFCFQVSGKNRLIEVVENQRQEVESILKIFKSFDLVTLWYTGIPLPLTKISYMYQ